MHEIVWIVTLGLTMDLMLKSVFFSSLAIDHHYLPTYVQPMMYF